MGALSTPEGRDEQAIADMQHALLSDPGLVARTWEESCSIDGINIALCVMAAEHTFPGGILADRQDRAERLLSLVESALYEALLPEARARVRMEAEQAERDHDEQHHQWRLQG